jgi:hypothetical protein
LSDLIDGIELGNLTKAKRSSADQQIDILIERRYESYRDDDECDPRWQKSARVHAEKIREARRVEWSLHHERLAVLHRRLADEHEAQARQLANRGQIAASENGAGD